MAKIVAIRGCPAGVAHTQMAAEALRKTAAFLGHQILVETRALKAKESAVPARRG